MAKEYAEMSVAALEKELLALDERKQAIRVEQLQLRAALDEKRRAADAEDRAKLRGNGTSQTVRPNVINLTAQARGGE